jgi:hypothetical protein
MLPFINNSLPPYNPFGIMKRKIIIEIISSLLILLFLYASVSRWLDFRLFIGEINNQPLPNWMTPYLVWSIPFIEVFIALALIFEKSRLPALYASVVLMLVFTIYSVAILLHAFKYIPCSCGGVIRKLTWPQHLVFNLFFVGISLAGIILKKQEPENAVEI